MTDAELESHISSLAILIEKAMVEGDTAGARAWAAARAEAIKARSPAQVARMELDYFGECGAADRAALGARS